MYIKSYLPVQCEPPNKGHIGTIFLFFTERLSRAVVSNVSQVLKKLVFGPVSFVWMDSFIQTCPFSVYSFPVSVSPVSALLLTQLYTCELPVCKHGFTQTLIPCVHKTMMYM